MLFMIFTMLFLMFFVMMFLFFFVFIIFLLFLLSNFFFLLLNFLFKLNFFEMLILQSKLCCLIVLFKIILEKFQCIENIMIRMVLVNNLNKLFLISFWNAWIQNLKFSPLLRVICLVHFYFNIIFLKHKVHCHFFIVKQGSDSQQIYFTIILLSLLFN